MGSARVDEAQLADWGAEFARRLTAPAVVGISGELGAGKTTLVRAIASGLGVAEPVTSPTFALVHRYAGRGVTVYHVDAYRLKRADDTGDLGFDDMLGEPDAVVLIEWPERLGAASPGLTHRVALAHTGEDGTRHMEWS
ncbi:MAG: tRNA (adenosine(37)-N6)-threonylcarbamoyltransferase complex ATPase subunit type 1 TsaE [Gemmatimonadetes bacterium]|nr:tRNA (adenosine(37)-N6)-threonylcarbamoyltransferase complex ATPase subunit type 1 TsaE [Gemmatimonadota bacterium]